MSNDEFSSRNAPTSNRQLLIILTIFLAFVVGLIWLLVFLVDSLVWVIPVSLEQQLGKLMTPAYEQIAKPSPAQDTLNQLLDRLETKLTKEQSEGRNYRVLYVPQPTVNALAIPGDTVIIFSGLVAQAKSENELMMVLGHELGHFAHRDHLRSLGRSLLFQIVLSYFFGDLGSLQSAISTVSSAQFSQQQERQADEFGLSLLQATYNHVAGATDFFERISEKQGDIFTAFLASHPNPRDRVTKLKQLIEQRHYKMGEKSPLPPTLKL
ncbi:peptidase M48 [Oscillatoriales cyanobacterium USR001]|nr:peptidase M48 [Oscillatoriales cyanobacterium USR001]